MTKSPEIGPKELEQGPETEKIEKYKEMIGDSKAIFVLDMGVRETNAKGIDEEKIYRPSSYSDIDIRGFMGSGHGIVIAAAEIAQYFPEIKLITTTCEKREGKIISTAKIYAKELKTLGIPEEQIELEEKSTNTITELIEMFKMAKKNGWQSVSILTTEVHIERVQAMLDHLEELAKKFCKDDKDFFEAWDYFEKGKKLQTHLLPSEEIMLSRNYRYQKIIEAVRNSDLYKKRVEAEKRGIKQIEDGTYGNIPGYTVKN